MANGLLTRDDIARIYNSDTPINNFGLTRDEIASIYNGPSAVETPSQPIQAQEIPKVEPIKAETKPVQTERDMKREEAKAFGRTARKLAEQGALKEREQEIPESVQRQIEQGQKRIEQAKSVEREETPIENKKALEREDKAFENDIKKKQFAEQNKLQIANNLTDKDRERLNEIDNDIARLSTHRSAQNDRRISGLQAEKERLMSQTLVQNTDDRSDTIDKWLDTNYKMTDSEVEQAKKIVSDFEANEYKNSNVNELTDEEKRRQSQMFALKDKISKPEAAVYGVMNATVNPLLTAADNDFFGWTLKDLQNEVELQGDISLSPEVQEYVDQLKGEMDNIQNTLNDKNTVYSTGDAAVDEVSGATTNATSPVELKKRMDELQAKIYKVMLESSRNKEQDYDSYKFRKENAQKQNPGQYYAGDLATRAAETAAVQGAMGSNGLYADLITDNLTDTLPEYLANRASGMDRNEATNQALLSEALNVGMDLTPSFWKSFADRRAAKKAASVATNTAEEAATATEPEDIVDEVLRERLELYKPKELEPNDITAFNQERANRLDEISKLRESGREKEAWEAELELADYENAIYERYPELKDQHNAELPKTEPTTNNADELVEQPHHETREEYNARIQKARDDEIAKLSDLDKRRLRKEFRDSMLMRVGFPGIETQNKKSARTFWKDAMAAATETIESYASDPERYYISDLVTKRMEELEDMYKQVQNAASDNDLWWRGPNPLSDVSTIEGKLNSRLNKLDLKGRSELLKLRDDMYEAIDDLYDAMDANDLDEVKAANKRLTSAAGKFDRRAEKIFKNYKPIVGKDINKPAWRFEQMYIPTEKPVEEVVDTAKKEVADEIPNVKPEEQVAEEVADEIPRVANEVTEAKSGFTSPDAQKVLDAYRAGERLSEYDQDVLEMALLEEKYSNLRKYSEKPVMVEKSEVPEDVLKEMIGNNYDNQPESVKLSAELAKRGYNLWENGFNNNIMQNYSVLQDAVAHHLAADNIPASIMAEAYDITYQNGGSLDDAIKLAAEMSGTELSNPTHAEGIMLRGNGPIEPPTMADEIPNVGKSVPEASNNANDIPKPEGYDPYGIEQNNIKTAFEQERAARLDEIEQLRAAGRENEAWEAELELSEYENAMVQRYPELSENGEVPEVSENLNPGSINGTPETVDTTPRVNDTINSQNLDNIPPEGENGEIPPGKDYLSKFRTHNEERFNLTDEELNNKWFNTTNENFHFIKGDRGQDAINAAQSLEDDYDGTVKKLLNKPTSEFFSPQEVDEGMMAWNNEIAKARETGDYSKSAEIIYKMTQDTHDVAAALQARAAWKRSTPAGVVLDANEAARHMAEDSIGKNAVKDLDTLSKDIANICNNVDLTREQKKEKIEALLKEIKGKGYKKVKADFEQLKLPIDEPVDTVTVRDALYEANKLPNIDAESQLQIAEIAQEMYGKDLTSKEKQQYINRINMILSKQKGWTLKEKAIEISHMLMLSGTRTHVRNILANVGMLPQESLARHISAIGQNAYKHFVNPDYKPTQAFHVSKESNELAHKAFEAKGGAEAIVEGIADKYTNRLADSIGPTYMFGTGKGNVLSKANKALSDKIPVLKKMEEALTERGEKALKKIGSEGAYGAMDSNASFLENYRQFIYGSLSGLEDNPFVKKNYEKRLASYIEAQGIKNIDDIPDEAFDLARAEALKATFKDDNAITDLFRSIKKMPVVGETLLPFTKTPANLIARSIDYSPLGIAKALHGMLVKDSKFAKKTVGEAIDELAKGVGGTLTGALAMFLYSKGMLTGKKDEDPDIANYMANEGWQEYSISAEGIANFINEHLGTDLDFGKGYYAYDWMQPITSDIIAAQELWDELIDGEKITDKTADEIFKKVKSIGGSYIDTLLEQSTMQNIAKLFDSSYSEGGAGSNFMDSILQLPTRYASGAINDITKLTDDTRREYYSKGKPVETVKNMMQSKLPVLSEKLPAKYDLFGHKMTRNNSEPEKWINTLANPSSTTHQSEYDMFGKIDDLNERVRAERQTNGEKDLNGNRYVPTKTNRSFNLEDGTKFDMDNEQFSEATRIAGETRDDLLRMAYNTEAFNSLSAENQSRVLSQLDKVAVSNGYTSIDENAKTNSDVVEQLSQYKGGDKQGLVDTVIKNVVAENNPYGLDKKTYQKMETEGEDTSQFEGYDVREQYGLNDTAESRQAWIDKGEEGLKELAEYNKAFEETCGEIYTSKSAKAAYESGDLDKYADYRQWLKDNDEQDDITKWAEFSGNKIDPKLTVSSDKMDAITRLLPGEDKADGYINYQSQMQEQGYTTLETSIPQLEKMDLSDTEKGKYTLLYNGKPKKGSSAEAAYIKYGYDGLYWYRLLQQADENNNGKKGDSGDIINKLYSLGYKKDSPQYNFFTSLKY